MRIGRLQVNWLKKPKRVDRELDLVHLHTFKNGVNAYTYKVEDLGKISGRYLDNVKNTLNFMLQYSAGPEQVKAFASNIESKLLQAIEETNPKGRLDHVIEAREISKRLPKLQDYVDDLHKKQWYDLYTMFVVIDGEQEAYFSPAWNAKKIELLETEPPEVQEVFFSFVENLITHFSDTYKNDLIASMIQERELASLATSLTLLTKDQAMKSPSADGEE